MALTPQNISAALAARLEPGKQGSSRQALDTGVFKTMLSTQLGVNKDILKGKLQDPMPMLTEMASTQPGNAPGFMPPRAVPPFKPSSSRTGPMHALERQAPPAPKAASQAASQPQTKAAAPQGQASSENVQGGPVSQKIARNEVRGPADLNARHPEDLGHLPGSGNSGPLPKGFTKEEEELLLAAAAAESKFLAARRRAAKSDASAPGGGVRLGVLSAAYESRGSIDAIGYDGRGGTSYGMYQIASGVGTMDRFLDYLDTNAPDIATRLEKAGPANTGGRHGSMATEWKRIAAEAPKRFEALQQDFIRQTHYEPALKSITMNTGEDISKRSQAMREVLWSTAVQHGAGGASEIFTQAIEKLQQKGQAKSDKALIEEIYSERMEQFSGRGRIRDAVASRLADEKQSALAMLDGKSLS